jgi:uncharacterized protein (DUF111 family)
MLARMGSFDVALLEALVSAGVSPERARAVVELLDRSIDDRYSLHAQILATKRDVAATKVDIAATKADLVKWVVGALTAQTALLRGAVKLF